MSRLWNGDDSYLGYPVQCPQCGEKMDRQDDEVFGCCARCQADEAEPGIQTVTPPLKPCPFCGSAPDVTSTTVPEMPLAIEWTVWCIAEECAVRPSADGSTEAHAAETWNTRVDPVPSSVSSAIEEEANAARRRHEGRTT